MWRGTYFVFLLMTFNLVLCLAKSANRLRAKRSPEPSDPDYVTADPRGAIPDLPKFDELVKKSFKHIDGEYKVGDCIIKVKDEANVFVFDLTTPSCRDHFSMETFYGKVLKKIPGLKRFMNFGYFSNFNVESVTFDKGRSNFAIVTKSKEPFQLVSNLQAEGQMTVSITLVGKLNTRKIGIHIEGNIKGNAGVTFEILKKENQGGAWFELKAAEIKIKDFVQLFANMGEKTAVNTKFLDTTISSPTMKGRKDYQSNAEIVLSASSVSIPGIANARVLVVANIPSKKKGAVGVLLEFIGISPVQVIKYLTKMKLEDVSILNDISVNVVIEYANIDITPEDDAAKELLNEVSGRETIEEGLKLKFIVPFGTLLTQKGITPPPNTNLDQYVIVNLKPTDGRATLSFEFAEDALMDVINIAIAFVPTVTKGALEKLFNNPPKVKFTTFDVDLKGDINIQLEATGTISFKVLTVDFLGVAINREGGTWGFSMHAKKSIGGSTFELELTKKGTNYVLAGEINDLTLADLLNTFSVDSKYRKALVKLKYLNFVLSSATISISFGDKLEVKMTSTFVFFEIQATFEGYVIETPEGYALAFGITMTNKGIGEVIQAILHEEQSNKAGGVQILTQKWMTQATTSLIFANKAAVSAITFDNMALQEAIKPGDIGVAFSASITIPPDCATEFLCKIVKGTIGHEQTLVLNGIVDRSKIEMKVGFRGTIKIGDRGKYEINEAGFMVAYAFDSVPEICIYGRMKIRIKDSDIDFSAKLGLAANLDVELTLTFEGRLEQPFGIPKLAIEYFTLSAGINLLTAMPSFALGGKLYIGDGSKAIAATILGGFATTSLEFHLYASFSETTVRSVLEAFNYDSRKLANIPKKIAESGFTPSITAGFAFPKGKVVGNPPITLPDGLYLKGGVNILGYQVQAEISAGTDGFSLKAELPRMALFNSALIIANTAVRSKGPEFEIAFGSREFKIKINAYVEVVTIGIGAIIEISSDQLEFTIVGSFYGKFDASVTVKAPIKDFKSMTREEFKIEACMKTDVTKNINNEMSSEVTAAVEDIDVTDQVAEKDAKAVGWIRSANTLINSAKKQIDKYTNKYRDLQEKTKKEKTKKKCIEKCGWTSVGGVELEPCEGESGIQCLVWVKEVLKVRDPSCVANCLKEWYTFWKGQTAKWKYQTLKALAIAATKVLAAGNKFLVSANEMNTQVKLAMQKFRGISEKVIDDLKNLKKKGISKMIKVKNVCVRSELQNGACFSIDAEFMMLATEHKLEQEECCFTARWLKDVAKKMIGKMIPSMESIKQKFKEAKNLMSRVKSDKDLIAKEKDAKANQISKRTREGALEDEDPFYLSKEEQIYGYQEDHILRDDETMNRFYDLFFSEKTFANAGPGGTDTEGRDAIPSINIDTNALMSTDDPSKRSQAVLNAYSGISGGLSALLKVNKKAKDGCLNLTSTLSNDFDKVEQDIRRDALRSNMSDYDTSEMLFYVTFGREGIANMRKRFDDKFNLLDKASLRSYRNYIGKTVAGSKLDVPSFLAVLKTASEETAKKCSVPEHGNGMLGNMNFAEQTMESLLSKDAAGLMVNEAVIHQLNDAVKNIATFNKDCP